MTQMQGMDIAGIRAFARQLAVNGERLPQLARELDGLLARSPWRGADADDFRAHWAGAGRVRLDDVGRTLRDLSAVLERQADEQERASAGLGATAPELTWLGFGGILGDAGRALRELWERFADGWSQVAQGAADLWNQLKGFGEDAWAWLTWLNGPDGPSFADITALVPGLQGALGDAMDWFMTQPGLAWLSGLVGAGLGFEYVKEGDFYTTNEHSLQSYLGFHDMYDSIHKLGGMDLHDKVIEVTGSDGKEYRLELWKGSYGSGSAFGGEIGLYVRDPHQGGLQGLLRLIPGFYPTAQGGDQIRMVQEIYNKTSGESYFTNDNRGSRDGDHFWNLAIRTEPGVGKDMLGQRGSLYFKDPVLAQRMAAAMRAEGLAASVGSDGMTVSYTWEER